MYTVLNNLLRFESSRVDSNHLSTARVMLILSGVWTRVYHIWLNQTGSHRIFLSNDHFLLIFFFIHKILTQRNTINKCNTYSSEWERQFGHITTMAYIQTRYNRIVVIIQLYLFVNKNSKKKMKQNNPPVIWLIKFLLLCTE